MTAIALSRDARMGGAPSALFRPGGWLEARVRIWASATSCRWCNVLDADLVPAHRRVAFR